MEKQKKKKSELDKQSSSPSIFICIIKIFFIFFTISFKMGIYLTTPTIEKLADDGENANIKYGMSCMQGWQLTKEDPVNTRQQTDRDPKQRKKKLGTIQQLCQVVKHEGWKRLYGGLIPSLVGTAASQVVKHEGWECLYGGLTPSLVGPTASQAHGKSLATGHRKMEMLFEPPTIPTEPCKAAMMDLPNLQGSYNRPAVPSLCGSIKDTTTLIFHLGCTRHTVNLCPPGTAKWRCYLSL